MRLLALAAVACISLSASALAQGQAADPPGLCTVWRTQWGDVSSGDAVQPMRDFLGRVPPSCRQLRGQIETFIARRAQAQAPAPTPNQCAGAQSRWAALRSSEDRAAVSQFLRETPASCTLVREAADQRLAALAAQQAPPTNPCEAAESSWAYLHATSDVARLERFVRETPPSCGTHARARARLMELRRPTTDAAAGLRPLQRFRDCDVCPEMVILPGGSFMMGAQPSLPYPHELPRHTVNIRSFAAARFEVLVVEWNACVADGECVGARPERANNGAVNIPTLNIDWADTQDFVRWLSMRTGERYRLLTEAEWEYAARAGSTTTYSNGDTIPEWQRPHLSSWTYRSVGSDPANAFGLHDMDGLQSEWVEDCYRDSYVGAPTDGSAVTTGDCSLRVSRGGGSSNYGFRSSHRFGGRPDDGRNSTGFRVARDL